MRKNSRKDRVQKAPKVQKISPEDAIKFLEDVRLMSSSMDEPTVAISLRVPGNILRSIKLKAKADGKKYQSLIVEYLRQGLQQK